MRILVIADIHGNWPALQAVAAQPHDVCLCLGDLVDYALEPAECIAWVKANAPFTVRGNHDHGVAQNVRVQARSGFKYLSAVTRPLTANAWEWKNCDFSAACLYRCTLTLDNTRFLLVHATPATRSTNTARRRWISGARRLQNVEADVVCVGHTHQPYVLEVGDKLVINPGKHRTAARR